jgi:Fatty acid desaturase
MHDAGHRQMFAKPWLNVLVGLLTADLLLGISYGWWVGKHNRHHANPNHVGLDPDIDTPAIAYTEAQAFGRRGVLRQVAKRQAFLFFPMLSFLGWATHGAGLTFLASRPSRFRRLEVGLLVLHTALYAGLLVALVGPWPAVLMVVIHKACGGIYMGSVFAPNHKGMLEVDVDSDLDFLRRQVLTSRNVRSNPLTDVWYGALNYQASFPPRRATGCGQRRPSCGASVKSVGSPTTRRRCCSPTGSCLASCTRWVRRSASRGPGSGRGDLGRGRTACMTGRPVGAYSAGGATVLSRARRCRGASSWSRSRPSQETSLSWKSWR